MRTIQRFTVTGVAAVVVLLAPSTPPALAAAPQAPVTSSPAQSITATSAVLEGTLETGAEHWYFAYSPSQYGPECVDDERTREEAVAGSLPATETAAITGLEPGRRYTFCLVASNGEGETLGNEVSFETVAVEPQLTEERIVSGSVTPFDAAFEAELNPENRVTTYRFEYATEAAEIGGPDARSFGEGALPAVYEQQATGPVEIGGGLKPATTYYYRVVANSAAGTTDGPIESFETKPLEAPLIEGESAEEITQTTAQLSGRINPEFQNTFCRTWQYVEETAFLQHGFAGALETGCGPPDIGGGGAGERVGSGTLALKPNTTYRFRVLAENASGLSEGPAQTFSSLPYPPAALTGAASAITATSATISGSVNPGSAGPNSATSYYFQYGTTTGYGAQAPLTPGDAGEGEGAVPETESLTGLQPGTTYHYRIVATNDNANAEGGAPQSDYGEDETFTTPATLLVLSGVSAQGVTQNGATIVATLLDPNGLPTRYELQLGSTPGLLQPAGSGDTNGTTPLRLAVESLSPGTTYYYRLIAVNADNPVEAATGQAEPIEAQGSFTTAPLPAGSAPLGLPALIPYASIAELDAKEAKEDKGLPGPSGTKALTRAQRLSKALKACKKKSATKRAACDKAAHKRYGSRPKKAKRKKKA